MDEQLEAMIRNWQSTGAAIDELLHEAGIEILQSLRDSGVSKMKIEVESGITRDRQKAIMKGDMVMTPYEYLELCRLFE